MSNNGGPANRQRTLSLSSLPRAERNARAHTEARAEHRNGGLALEVLGKLREIFRAAKLPATASARTAGVTGAELWALGELRRYPGVRVSDLAALLSLRQSTVSNLVERLAQARLVSRRRNDADRRVVRLYLTRAGERLLARTPGAARGVLPDALERLSAAELLHLDAQLSRLLGAMARRGATVRSASAPRA